MIEDRDPVETQEWLDALDSVIRNDGPERAAYLLSKLSEHAVQSKARLPMAITTPFRNTISPSDEKRMPGDLFMERRIRSLVRWNALAMVMRANDNDEGLGGHISSFSSSATRWSLLWASMVSTDLRMKCCQRMAIASMTTTMMPMVSNIAFQNGSSCMVPAPAL